MMQEELINWHFDELIKILITLSSTAERQKEIMGFGAVADEMAIEFDSHYTEMKTIYINRNIVTHEQAIFLDRLDDYLNNKSGNKDPDFWDDDMLEVNPDWNYVRESAKNILTLLNKQNFDVKIERTIAHTKSNKGEPLIIESTFLHLIENNTN
jgi:hypothetical protein